jgi:death-on-curing protein
LIFPTLENIVELNRQHIERSGGTYLLPDNLRNRASLEWVLDAIRHPLFGADPYPTLADKAALLTWVIIAGHVFHDGCKRTGMASLRIFVELNGFRIEATREERRDVALAIATSRTTEGGYSREEFVQWINDRIHLE